MTKEEYIKRVKKNIPDVITDYRNREGNIETLFLTPEHWSISHYNDKTFSFFRYYFAENKAQLNVNFIGEFEDWDEDTIDRLCKEYIDSYNKVSLQVKEYKLKHELDKLEGDFND